MQPRFGRFTNDEIRVLWAAMLAMRHDIHSAQDQLNDEQWDVAYRIYEELEREMGQI